MRTRIFISFLAPILLALGLGACSSSSGGGGADAGAKASDAGATDPGKTGSDTTATDTPPASDPGDGSDPGAAEDVLSFDCPRPADPNTDCDAICAKLVTCQGGKPDPSCALVCSIMSKTLAPGVGTTVQSCITGTDCSVAEATKDDLGGYCFQKILSERSSPPNAPAVCGAIETKLKSCGTPGPEVQGFAGMCLNILSRALASDLFGDLQPCADKPCAELMSCLVESSCGFMAVFGDEEDQQ